MELNRTLLLGELEELMLGLRKGNTLVLKQKRNGLLCQFLFHGLVIHSVIVKNVLLATALCKVGETGGIIDGADYMSFKNNFSRFSLHLKARQLYAELEAEQLIPALDLEDLLVA